jgi:tetratricopeptide (TPR) repeat protein
MGDKWFSEGGDAPDVEQETLDPTGGLATNIAMNQVQRRTRAGEAGDPATEALIEEQTRILRLQGEHLHEQRNLQLSHLRARRISEWMRVMLQVLTAVVGVLVLGAVVVLCRTAANSRQVVVEAFDAPPAMAARGASGKVIAGAVLDALTRIQDATRSSAAKRKLANAWSGDIKVEVPETGMSAGELVRLLHRLLGHDVHIEGDVVQEPGGQVSLTVRGDGIVPKTFTGPESGLAGLTTQAAEYAYGQAEPYLYASYLGFNGRSEEALAFLAKAYPNTPRANRPEMLTGWGNQLFELGRTGEAADKYRRAVELKPRLWKAWANLILVLERSEGAEAALRAGRRMAELARHAPMNHRLPPGLRVDYDMLRQDYPAAAADLLWDMKKYGDRGAASTLDAPELALVEADRHDWAAVHRLIEQSDPDDPSTKATRLLLSGAHALEAGQYAPAAAALTPIYARWSSDAAIRAYYPDAPCLLGEARMGLGDRASAEQLFAQGGSHWLACLTLHAGALDRAGDWNGAEAIYRRAIAGAPDLPLAHTRYGEALLRRGDLARARAQFALAHAQTPAYADPLKGLGDVLARQGRWLPAREMYAQALKSAPNWLQLRQAYAEAKARR